MWLEPNTTEVKQIVKMSKFDPEKWIERFKKVPLIYQLLFSKSEEHQKLKACFGFVYGFCLGLIFHRFVLSELSFSEDISFWLAVTICLVLGWVKFY